MTAPLYVVVLPVSITLCIIADRTPHLRPIYLTGILIMGGIFSALNAAISAFDARYVFLCFINIAVWSANPLALSFASTTFGPVEPEIRAILLAAMNGFGNLAQIYGSYLFPSTDAPQYLQGFCAYAAILCLGGGLYFANYHIFRKKPLKPST